jgi:asparagine synthase (glutamine-hydrolysing)
MCGIAGIINKNTSNNFNKKLFEMSQSIKHRGPDGEGFVIMSNNNCTPIFSEDTPQKNCNNSSYNYNPQSSIHQFNSDFNFGLSHRRLSIIDLSEAGHQPMCDISNNYWITFNGEVYNYLELKTELILKGHVFVSNTDTEVVIASYKEWGTECLKKFNGMFAFALYDKIKNIIICARDRAGVKPFYYTNTNECFAFASEYKAFIKSKIVNFEINEPQMFEFLINETLETTEQSLFKNIFELKPANFIVYNLIDNNFTTHSFYDYNVQQHNHFNEKEIVNLIEEKLIKSIECRLRSDVEIGSCLSGGIDSSVIAGVYKHLLPTKQLKLFTAVFPNEKFDESRYAQLMSLHVNGVWQTVSPTPEEFFRDIESLNYSQDLPVWSTSTYSQYRVMKLAAENNIKVLLDGQGADELFAGYTHHYLTLWKESFGFNTIKKIQSAKQTVPNGFKLYAKQLIKENFNLSVNYSSFFIKEKNQLSNIKNQSLQNSLNKQLLFDYKGKLKSFLKCEDRCSMAFGIESRVPFADDIDLFELMFSIEGKHKIQNGVSKFLLREASKKYLPKDIYARRDKIGFEAPVKTWLLLNKKNIIESIERCDFIDINYISSHFDYLLQRKSSFLFRLYSLSIWIKAYKEKSKI